MWARSAAHHAHAHHAQGQVRGQLQEVVSRIQHVSPTDSTPATISLGGKQTYLTGQYHNVCLKITVHSSSDKGTRERQRSHEAPQPALHKSWPKKERDWELPNSKAHLQASRAQLQGVNYPPKGYKRKSPKELIPPDFHQGKVSAQTSHCNILPNLKFTGEFLILWKYQWSIVAITLVHS